MSDLFAMYFQCIEKIFFPSHHAFYSAGISGFLTIAQRINITEFIVVMK